MVIKEPRTTSVPGEEAPSRRPPDECPHPKPFRADFDGCPAFQVKHLIVLDSQNKPLKPIWSCRHLEARAVAGRTGRYYGACQFGDSAARQKWAEGIGLERIRAIQQLRVEVMPIAQGFIDAMGVLKARQIEAAHLDGELEDIRLGMEALGEEYLAELDEQLRRRLALLERAQMPKRALLQLAKQWVGEVIQDTWATPARRQHLPDDLLAALPESVRRFYAPPAWDSRQAEP